MNALAADYAGKSVFLTGHTGFKGSWLSLWLTSMGAKVTGYSTVPPTTPAMFDLCGVADKLTHHIGDVRDVASLQRAMDAAQPDIVFHLAAQPLVRLSYAEPVETLDVNVMGTAHVLEAVRKLDAPCAVVVVTSDKCYENNNWVWGYRETDPMGGSDPYSMSKGAAELVVSSWRRSFFSGPNSKVALASGRAGNVIGGGDWAEDRIVTDCVAAVMAGRPISVRNPLATRPWQHVLEPLSGYLWLGANLMRAEGMRYAEGWNFGPNAESVCNVEALVDVFLEAWGEGEWRLAADADAPKEAMSLALNCDKAVQRLRWGAVWNFRQSVQQTVAWYKAWGANDRPMIDVTTDQIKAYERDARARGLVWALDKG